VSSRAALVIWNATAAGGKPESGPERGAALLAALRIHGIEADLFESPSEADTVRRVDQAVAEGVSTIVAAGGDGTVRSVAFRLLGSDVALGILPLGTAMNVARGLGIPLDLDGAAAVLTAGRVRSIDVGEARDTPFLEIASVGLAADVLAGATEVGEGRLQGALDVLRAAWRYRRTRVTLDLDGREVHTRALSLAVANGRFTGRGMALAPEARLDDGKFDVLVFRGYGGLRLLAHLVRVLLGGSRDPRVSHHRAARVRITSHRPLPVRLDSKDLGSTPIELVTRSRALKVIAP
jgi:YegS/Rv2252/BmrU family lipid kinase